MARSLVVEDILNDVEFEIAQGVITTGGLGEGVQAVRQYQNKLRAETFKSMKVTDPDRELISRQFQVNDMLINLLQETVLTLEAIRVEVKKLRGLPERVAPGSDRIGLEIPGTARTPAEDQGTLQESPPSDSSEEIESAMRPEAIEIDLQARPINLPIIGWLLTRLRIFYQRPALFYTRLFANRQGPINRVYGDRILNLEARLRMQQQQIQELNARLSAGHSNLAENLDAPIGKADDQLA
jgi:hypothetical protein